MALLKNILPLLLLVLFGSCWGTTSRTTVNLNELAEEDRIITISGEAHYFGKCSRKCVRISNVNVQFDECYNQDTKKFNTNFTQKLDDTDVFSKLLNTEVAYWAEIENEIDANHDVDAGLPFIVTVTTKQATRSFILLRIDAYPTKEYGDFMAQVASIFDNWDDYTHVRK